jgi:glycosyltransferase involved in cell wall biosynthesis
MRVLFLGPIGGPLTGHSLACKVLLEELSRHHAVEVVDLSGTDVRQGVTLTKSLRLFRLLWRIWRARRSCDGVYFTISESYAGNIKDLLIYLVCWAELPKTVVHLHGGAGMRRIMRGPHRILAALNRPFLRRIGAMIVLGARHVDIFEGVVDADKLHIVPNFAEDYLFSTTERIEEKFRDAVPLRILFVSNFLIGKGHQELVAAYGLLDDAVMKRVRIDFAGAFETEEQRAAFLGSIVGARGLCYRGAVYGAKKGKLFSAAHVFCLPTYYPYEGQPISILEAYASGCAVITTDHSGIFDIFEPNVNGYAVEKRSAQALKEAIAIAAADSGRLRRMALANFETAVGRYRAVEYTAHVVGIIESVGA